MFTNGIALNHQVAVIRHQEFLDQAKKEYDFKQAFAQNQLQQQNVLATLRAALATTLFRAATWLMPAEHDRRTSQHVPHGLELRPGR